ncbi:hypothetical protein B0H13DRAFT_1935737 [Mycena leptocephala]|nr:hypothetical protein B0H13DRAFT_1935737 [Mycena leptocephala]
MTSPPARRATHSTIHIPDPGPQPIQGRSRRKAPDAAARRRRFWLGYRNGVGGSAGEEGAMIVDDEEDVEGDERREFSPQRSRSHSPTRDAPNHAAPPPPIIVPRKLAPSAARRDRRGPPQYREPPPEIVESDNSDPDDDYETTQKAKEREFERNKRFHPSATRTEDEDEEDEEDFLEQVRQGEIQSEDETGRARKRRNRAGKRVSEAKGKARWRPGTQTRTTRDETRRSGPFSKELKKEADELGAEFKKNVPRCAEVWERPAGRSPIPWLAHQGASREERMEFVSVWKSAPDGRNDMMPDDRVERQGGRDYKQALRDSGIEPDDKPDTAHILEALPYLRQWADNSRTAVLDYRIESGAFAGDVNKVVAMLTKLCTLAYDELGLHAFGHVIDVADGQSRAFNRLDQRKTLREYEHKIGVIETQLKKVSTSGDATSDASPSEWVSEGWNRDKGRAYIKDRLVLIRIYLELTTISVTIEIARGDLKAEDEAARKYQIWVLPKQGFQQTAFSTSDLKEIIPPLEKAQGNPKYADDSRVKVEKCLRVVEWTEDERDLPQAEQGDVPLVVSVKGNVLVKVASSKKFVAKTGTIVRRTKPRPRASTQERPRKRARDEEPLPTSPEPAGSSSPGAPPAKRISFRAQGRFSGGPAKPGASRHAAAPARQLHQGYPENAEAGPSRRPQLIITTTIAPDLPTAAGVRRTSLRRSVRRGYGYGYGDDTRAGAGQKRRLKALAEGYLAEGRVLGCLQVGSEKSAWMSGWVRDCPDDQRSKADKHTEIDDGGVFSRLTSGRFEPEVQYEVPYLVHFQVNYQVDARNKSCGGKGPEDNRIGYVPRTNGRGGSTICGNRRLEDNRIGDWLDDAGGLRQTGTMPRTPRTPSTSSPLKPSGREGQPSITLYHKLFHIACYQADDHAHWLMLTDLELTRGFRLAERGGPTEPELCTHCHCVVPLHGFARYCREKDGMILPASSLCKACHLWAAENINNECIIAPQCICPGESNTPDCPFHSVAPAAKQLVPPGVPWSLPVVYRFNRIGGVWGEPGSTFNELAAAISAWRERRAGITIATSRREVGPIPLSSRACSP